MAIEEDLGTYLETNVTLVNGRVHAMKLPQGAPLPALVFLRVSGVPLHSHSGYSHFTTARFQVSCWAQTFKAVRELAAQVRAELDGFSGLMGATEIGHCLCIADRDAYEAEPKKWHAPLDFTIGFQE